MNPIIDANCLYDAGTAAMKSSKFKYCTQKFEARHLLETALLQRSILTGQYKPTVGKRFVLSERGKIRWITANLMIDKTVNHVISDELIMPAIGKYLIYDNGASQKGKGVSFTRRRFEYDLHRYFRETGSNEGYILLGDFSGFYSNIRHKPCIDILLSFMLPYMNTIMEDPSETEKQRVIKILQDIFKSFETDVSYLDDDRVAALYHEKVDPMMNRFVDPALLTGRKMLAKGVDIGNQISQGVGIVFPYQIDNYVKIVCGMKHYSRYTDDTHVIHRDKETLENVLKGMIEIADRLGIIINKKKTRIIKASSFFRFMQIGYQLTDTGKLIRKINPKSITRERRKLKAYKRLLEAGTIDYPTIENSFKSWLGSYYKMMSRQQIYNLNSLYVELFGKKVTWKKGHSRLNWLMTHLSTTSPSTGTVSSAKRR